MAELLTIDNFITLGLLTLLQAVLGFDNLLYISLESRRAPAAQQAKVRRIGIVLAVFLRIGLLLLLVKVIAYFQDPIFGFRARGILEASFNLHSLIVLLGGVLIIYIATKEIFHMIGVDNLEHEQKPPASLAKVITWIVIMNLVFSFDSILSAMALTSVFSVMATAIVIGGVLMIWLSDRMARFLQKNRLYEVLGLFILFVVGIMLLSEGGHLAHLEIAGHEITPMSKATFYFVIGVMVLTDVVQNRYQRKLMAPKHTPQVG
ncbi:MAG: tellurium resistance protein TerC [Acidobacteria bacterium]|nr:tellurium resistance protein TerC [Acidobacteriota bacterium]